jgi:hypothetical protein
MGTTAAADRPRGAHPDAGWPAERVRQVMTEQIDEIPTLGLTRRRCEQIVGRGNHVLDVGLPGADREHDDGSVECDLARSAPRSLAQLAVNRDKVVRVFHR